MIELVAIVIPLAILAVAVVALLKKPSMELETRSVAEHVSKSPSLRIVALIVRELWRNSAAILAVLAIVATSVMAASTAATTFIEQKMPFEPPNGVEGVAICTGIEPCLEPSKFWKEAQLSLIQVLDWVRIGGDKFMPILVKYTKSVYGSGWLEPLKSASKGYLVIDYRSRTPLSTPPGVVGVIKLNLSELVSIEVAPSTPVVPSLGIVGGVSIVLRDPRKLAILPLNKDTTDFACGGRCVARCILISFTSPPPINLTNHGCVVVMFSKGLATIVSSARAPTPASLLSIALSTAMSSLVAVIACGVVVEKLRSFLSSLIIQGVSRDAITVASSMGALALSLTLLPASIALSSEIFGFFSSFIAAVTHVSSSMLFSYSMSRYVSKSLSRSTTTVRTPLSLELSTRRSVSEIANCIRKSLERDDNFVLSELEILEPSPGSGRYVIRFELVYRKAMAILASVELELEKLKDKLRVLCALTDVWSFEEVSEKTRSVESLALSRAVGTLWLCAEANDRGNDGCTDDEPQN